MARPRAPARTTPEMGSTYRAPDPYQWLLECPLDIEWLEKPRPLSELMGEVEGCVKDGDRGAGNKLVVEGSVEDGDRGAGSKVVGLIEGPRPDVPVLAPRLFRETPGSVGFDENSEPELTGSMTCLSLLGAEGSRRFNSN